MKLWKFNKRSSTLADMSMNRVLLTELIAKGALVGVIAGFFGASYRYLILESEHIRWHLMDGITMEWAIGWLVAMVIFAFIVDRLLAWAPLSGGSGIPQIEGEMLGLFDMKPYRTLVSKMIGGVLTGCRLFCRSRRTSRTDRWFCRENRIVLDEFWSTGAAYFDLCWCSSRLDGCL